MSDSSDVKPITDGGSDVPAGADVASYRAKTLFQPHRARQALRDAHEGKIPPLIAFICLLSSPQVIKVAAQLGFDIVMIDQEHSAMNIETMTDMVHNIQFMSEGKSMAWVRVAGHDHANIGYCLDAGASIMVPQVETVEDARHITSAAKFGANINGTRSVPPARFMPGLSDIVLQSDKTLWQNLNDQAAIIIQIESLRAIINLDDILTECGDHIDSVWLGSLDARASMGLPGMSGTEPEWLAAVATFDAALRKHDKPYSGFSIPGPPEVMKAAGERKSMLAIGTDISGLMMQIDVLNDARKNFPIRNYSAENKGPGFDAQINENKKTE